MCHHRGELDPFRINRQASEEAADAFEEIEEHVIAYGDAKSGLR
jgi:hypothetical protein